MNTLLVCAAAGVVGALVGNAYGLVSWQYGLGIVATLVWTWNAMEIGYKSGR